MWVVYIHDIKSLQKKQLLAKFHFNSSFLLLRNNSDKIPQNTSLYEIRL